MEDTQEWFLFVLSLSGAQGAARIRVWRALKAAGAAAVRDGVYLLPASDQLEALVREQQREIVALGGTAFVFPVPSLETDDEPALRALFDRSEDYAVIVESMTGLSEDLERRTESDARRTLRQLKRDLAGVEAIDYFPGSARKNALAALSDAEARFTETFSPGEPIPERRAIPEVRREDYQGKVWATRARPWVDRVASAWLIRRFIDPAARFTWFVNARDCPKSAIGYDFDGAPFTHVDELVTFEVLLASFGLTNDPALRRLGSMVRGLDLGRSTIPEGAGFEALLAGARDVYADDDALVSHMSQTLDFLYAAFAKDRRALESERS